MDKTQARYAHRIALLLRSRHAHLADDNRSPATRGERASRKRSPASGAEGLHRSESALFTIERRYADFTTARAPGARSGSRIGRHAIPVGINRVMPTSA
jgi:hypothetical protein